ncbi:MAG: phage portal protein [Prevotella sp.]|nr:phage portal protein [Bacteroidaceae bacterium]MBQ6751953.1 phage portal protein [Bacteroidaceae bacterium]MBR0265194.1 phage portal protein [Prevotella sp.]
MNWFQHLFSKKSTENVVAVTEESPQPSASPVDRGALLLAALDERRLECNMSYMDMYKCIPEVFFPIEYIASRISGGNFLLKKEADDSVVWRNKTVNSFLNKPNCVFSWKEFVHDHFVWKLATGTSFIRAVTSIDVDYRSVLAYWVLPSDRVEVRAPMALVPLYDVSEVSDLIASVDVMGAFGVQMNIDPRQVMIDRDGIATLLSENSYMKAHSRLDSLRKNIANLLSVYDARNVIFTKRGGIGYIVSKKMDATGTDALTEAEKKQLVEQNAERYGIGKGQLPYGISDVPIDFVRTNLSIAELQPFDETLADAINIAGAYGVPAVLVPRKDQSTFSNQATAEKTVYASVVIPMAKEFCKMFTSFIGLDRSGYYLDVDFSGVDCMQDGMKTEEEVKKLVNDRCRQQFLDGLITLNDWRGQIGEAQIEEKENPLFSKLKFDMTDEELEIINKIIQTKQPLNNNGNRADEKPGVQNQGE